MGALSLRHKDNFPFFLFLAFALGKNVPVKELIPGLLGITFFLLVLQSDLLLLLGRQELKLWRDY